LFNNDLISFKAILESIENNKNGDKIKIVLGPDHYLEFGDKILNRANGIGIGWYLALDGLEIFNMFDGLNSENIALLSKQL